jgi:hypothetical protein
MVNEYMTVVPEECVDASKSALRQRMYCFALSARFKKCSVTHVAQNTTHSFYIITDFVAAIQQQIRHHNISRNHVLNRYETNCDWAPPPNQTWNHVGARSVEASQCTSVFLCITASCEKLDPFVIYSGSKTGRILKNELVDLNGYTLYNRYTVQKKAWMNEETSLDWLEVV